jgi:gas vesicle protein
MSNYYDRPDSGGGNFMIGLFTGALLGAGLGLLLAPKTGSEFRRQLRDRAGALADTAEEGYRRASDTLGDFADRGRDLADRGREAGREMFNRASDAAREGVEEAQRYGRDVASNLGDTTGRG